MIITKQLNFYLLVFILLLGCKGNVEDKTTSNVALSQNQNQDIELQNLNFIILLGDDISAKSLGCYGSPNGRTSPTIDRLAKEGIQFTNMFVSEAICAPTRAELYTGLQPLRNGCFRNHLATNSGTKSIVHYLSELGYRVGLSGKEHFKPKSVYPFEIIEGFPKHANSRYQSSENWTEIEQFITRDKEQPFCMVLSSIHAHAPWDAGNSNEWNLDELVLPPHFVDTKETRMHFREYLAEVKLFDGQVAKTLEMMNRLQLNQNTVFIVLDENGTGMPGGKWTNYDWGVRSACVMKWPEKYLANKEIDVLTQYCDILPTLIEAAGGKTPENMDGKSLLNLITKQEKNHREYAFFTYNNIPDLPDFPIRAVTDGTYKLVWNLNHEIINAVPVINGFDYNFTDNMLDRSVRFIYLSWLEKAKTDAHAQDMVDRYKKRPEFELYNLNNDPWEMDNLIYLKKSEPHFKRLKEQLEGWIKQQENFNIQS